MTGCREWRGARSHNYSMRWVGGRMVYVHRWVWEQVNGPIPLGMCILHRCDNPPCFLYDHLFLGTRADNVADMVSKGRCRNRDTAEPRERRPVGEFEEQWIAEMQQKDVELWRIR